MSEGLNKVMLLGNLGADPELRVTQGGQAVLKLRIATTENYLDKSNVRQEKTEWHQVTMWGKRAEALAKFLKKGDRLFIEGGLRTSTYDKGGEKRYSTEVNATNVILAGGGNKPEGGSQPRAPRNGAPATSPSAASDGIQDAEFDDGGGDDSIPF